MKSFKQYQFRAALFCLVIALALWAYEGLFLTSPKGKYAESPYAFGDFAHFMHYLTGYKIIFPALGLMMILILAYILRPLLTKNQERP